MASNEQLEQLRRSLECPICLEQTRDPRALPCLHSYCEECLRQHMAEKEEHNMFPCPICNTKYPIPDEGVLGFKRNFFVANIGEILLKNDTIYCDICKIGRDREAEFICIQCRQHFCRECSQAHSFHTNDHRVVSLEEVKNGQHMDEMRRHQKVYCSVHQEKVLESYCEQCEIPICSLCYVLDHMKHKGTDIGNAAERATRVMRDLLEPWRNVAQHYEMLCEKLKQMVESLGQDQETCESEKHLSVVTCQVEDHQEKAIQRFDEQVQAAKKQAEAACDEAELNRGKFVSVLQYVNSILASANDAEKLQQFREIRKRLENLNVENVETQLNQPAHNLQPGKVESANLGLNALTILNYDSSSKLCQTLVKTVAVSCKSSAHRVASQPAVKEPAQLEQILNSQREGEKQGWYWALAVDDGVLVIVDGENQNVKGFGKNRFTFQFSLKQHKLKCPWDVTINANGEIFITDRSIHGIVKYYATGGVIKVYPDLYVYGGYVTCHRNQLVVADTDGGRVMFMDYNCKVHYQIDARSLGLNTFSPRYICVNVNTGHLVAIEWEPGRVHVIDCDQPAIINTYRDKLSDYPRGVCVDQFGNTLVADLFYNRVILFTNTRAHVMTPQGGVSWPTGVCVSAPGEVSVQEYDGQVKVFRYLDI